MQLHAPRPQPRTIPLTTFRLALIVIMTAIMTAAIHAYTNQTGAIWQATTFGASAAALAVFLWDRDHQALQRAQRFGLEVRGLSNRLGDLEAGQKDSLQLLSVLIDEAQASASVWRDNEPVTFPVPEAQPDPIDAPPDWRELAERAKVKDPSGPQALPHR